MIDVTKYKTILDEGLMLDHYMLLCYLRDGAVMVESKRLQGFVNLMCKKGYIEDGVLTDKAMRLLDGEGNPIPKPEVQSTVVIHHLAAKLEKAEPDLKVDRKFDYADWVIKLHMKCEEALLKATGKRQVRDKIDGKAYSFLPNSTDLGRVILRVVNVYKLSDFNKIERTILQYINRCAKANKWFPILGYYIMKNSMSPMVTDMESLDEEEHTSNDDSITNI